MYMPNIVTAATVSVLFYNMFYGHGPIAELVSMMGGAIDINKGWTSMLIIAFIQFWMWYGNTMLILMSGIMGISPSYYEAARVDGATSMQQFWKITFPMLAPAMTSSVMLLLTSSLKAFDLPFALTSGGPGYATTMITQTIITEGVSANRVGFASAMSMLFLVLIGIFTIIQNVVMRKREEALE
jgi:ABC-type sugar transport system permease subunit